MAHRHVFPIISTALAGPGPSSIARCLQPSSVKRPFLLSPVYSYQPSSIPRRWSSTNSPLPSSEKKKAEEVVDDVWNLPPPPSTTRIETEGGREGGLPIPENIATSSTSFTGTGSTAGGNITENDSTSSDPSGINQTPQNIGPSSDTPSEPNHPTIPSFTSSTSSGPSLKSNDTSNSYSSSYSPRIPTSISIPPEVRERMTEWSTTVLQHSKRVAKDAQKSLMDLGLKVNEMTGYKEVERLKGLVFEKEDNLQKLRESARSAKSAYDEAVSLRSNAQRDVNSLLERKHSWDDSDVLRFTHLVRQDHSSSHAVARTSDEMKEKELKVDKAFNELMQTILQRYHEEQVWSDKIRSVSTYANLLGLALNAIIFLGAIVIVEPWKRKRLVNKLEERMSDMMRQVESGLRGLESQIHEGTVRGNVTVGDLEMVYPLATQMAPDTKVEEIASTEEVISPMEKVKDTPILIELATPPLDTLVPLPPTTPILEPIFKTHIDGLPPYLNSITQPSQERDMALAGVAGAALMGMLMTLGKWVFS
ncbi:hypothetical protein I302_107494 [Kwoniella bestiolae CBS 10118]|uniref:Sensitive to high expression protein 9, mitochondrial n=1 Tax=Kwoniella bestiolae CBS 10118 TaxID=1296100 RepID=A0A1B9FYE1_9TREE|nr:hypothetical protein I302_06765 [Kwoniella bestiolae CBS 10118]OCF23781.1 hypothetical protein I302_06765 [Kwoniella bestiolae CBS 10118]